MRIHHYLRSAMAVLLAVFAVFSLTAAEQHGKVQFGGLPVPGATVTVTQGDKKVVVITDENGIYSFPDLAEGTWSFQVEMQGFTPVKQDVTVAAAPAAPAPIPSQDFDLKMLPIADMNAQTSAPVITGVQPGAGDTQTAASAPANTAPPNNAKGNTAKSNNGKSNNAKGGAPAASTGAGFQRADVQATAGAPAPAPASESAVPGGDASQSPSELSQRATDGYLVNGSSVNGASSQYGLNQAIGNNRRGPRSLYNGNIGFNLDNSSLDARTYSLTGQATPKLESTKFTGLASYGGPLRIPHVLRNGPNFVLNYQWTRNRNAVNQAVLVPTAAERGGDFSQVLNPLTQKPVQIIDPTSCTSIAAGVCTGGTPFAGNLIPSTRLSPQALALLNLYPLPNFTGSNSYNYQVPLVTPTHQDAGQARVNKQLGRKNSIIGQFGFQSTRSDSPSVFGFLDTTNILGMNANVRWQHTFTPRLYGTFQFTFNRYSIRAVPYFENRVNIAGNAGISGDNQQPTYWGPPSLNFAGSQIFGLSDGTPTFNRNMTNTGQYDSTWNHGRHNVQFGANYQRIQFNSLNQSNPRGSLSFTGAATGPAGSDFADFLLGVPDTSMLAYGNADKYFRSYSSFLYLNDDWRVSPGLTLNLGIRWEYNSPITELYGRLVNLDVGPGYTSVAPVVANNPVGSLTGQKYADSLVNPDKHEYIPRFGLAWRPISGSSMVVRAGYGVAYNTSIYQSIASQMSQQSPLSTSLQAPNVNLPYATLANPFIGSPNITLNNFAIDPNFRVGYVQTWQVQISRDLPASLQLTATYNGNKGTRALQEFYPNSYVGVNPCPLCQSGYIYLTSNGNSNREAGMLQLRRRLHNGFTANLQYTYAKAIDDSAGLGGGAYGGAFAQNWLDLDGERSRSSFDQRHQAVLNLQYTTGQGIGGGTLVSGWRGQLLKEWTFVDTITAGTGLPLNPTDSAILLQGTTAIGGIRPDYTGASLYGASGLNLNPQAFTAPPAGQFGDAGRNIITGPSQFFMNATMARTFRLKDRYSLDLTVAATNVLNHVVDTNWVTNIASHQFGLPNAVNPMRSVLTTVRVRF
jgi:hypothetical protein